MADIVDPFQSIVDPFAAPRIAVDPFAASMAAGPIRTPDTSALQNVKVAARAASPYATAAGVGALAGAPFGGPVGSAAGAGLATLGLAAGDVGATGYNALANYMGWNRMPTPSETIQNAYGRVGVGARPQTSEQAMLDAAVSGATGAGGQARAFSTLARGAQTPVARGVMTNLGQQPAIQMGAGAGGAAAPTALQEYGDVTDPYALVGSSLAGSILGGKGAASAGNVAGGARATAARLETPSSADLRTQAQNAYRQADDAGVVFRPQAYTQFVDDVRQLMNREGFTAAPVPGTPQANPNIATAMARIEAAATNGQPMTFDALDRLRRDAGAARMSRNPDGSPNNNERRLGLRLSQAIDTFTLRPPPGAIAGGDHAQAAQAITDARRNWARMSKSEEIEDAVQRARISSPAAEGGKIDEAIRTQFAGLTREIDNGWHPGFTEAEVANIRRVAEGRAGSDILRMVSQLKPGTSAGSVIRTAAQLAAGTAAAGGPMGLALAVPTMAAGYGARAGRNALAELNAANLAAGIRRGDVTAPFNANMMATGSPMAQQFLNALANQ